MSRIYKVPRAVEEANRRADEILAEMDKPSEEQNEDTPEVEIVDNTTSEKIPVKEEVVNQGEDKTRTPEYFEHRLKTVQGMWEADKRRHSEELNRIRNDSEARLQHLEAKLKEVPAVPQVFDIRSYFDDNEIEQFGDNLPKVVMRVASKISQETAEREVNRKLETELEPVRREVENTRVASQDRAKDAFWSAFQSQVPNWQEINTDKRFHDWLAEVEPLVGVPRQQILTQAETSLDANRVVTIFRTFGNSIKQNQTEAQARMARKELPDSGSAAPSTLVDNSATFTAADIKRHYDDLNRGIYKNKMDKWVALERRINEAYAAGRVSPG